MAVDQWLPKRQAISPEEARFLATETKSVPQTQEITPRYLLKLLPWVAVQGGVYRVNRRRTYLHGNAKVPVSPDQPTLMPEHLRSIGLFRHANTQLMGAIVNCMRAEECAAGHVVLEEKQKMDALLIVVDGTFEVTRTGRYGTRQRRALMSAGDHFGEFALLPDPQPGVTVRALTPGKLFRLDRAALNNLLDRSPDLARGLTEAHLAYDAMAGALNGHGERRIAMMIDPEGEPELPDTHVEYAPPQEYELKAIQSVLRINTRVHDLYSSPHDQMEQQMRLTVEAIKEQQESLMINHPEFGLLSQIAPQMRIPTHSGPPTPDDMDELIARVWKQPSFFLAHPSAIAAFGRECTRRGVPPATVTLFGGAMLTWRGIPVVPCDKLPVQISADGTPVSDILLMRVGEAEQGVVGLCQAGEAGPSLNVRLMGITDKAMASYLVSLYTSAAVLTDDAIGMLSGVELGYYHDYR